MSEKKKTPGKRQDEDKTQKEKTELDKELDQTFPASDPPSRTRPGHEKDKKQKNDS